MSDPITSAQSGPLDLHLPTADNQQQRLEQIANGFEEMFLRNYLKTARESEQEGGSDELFGSSALNQYESMFDEHLARELAGKLGVADQIIGQLRRYVTPSNDDTTAAETPSPTVNTSSKESS